MCSEISDDVLIKKFKLGDNKSFDILLNKYQHRVFSYIFKMVKDNELANDIFQDVFIKVITSLKKDNYNHEGKLISWILRIAHNQVIDFYRKDSKMSIIGRSANVSPDFNIFDLINLEEDSIEDLIVSKQILKDVKRLVDHLPKDQKEVVFMRYFKEMSFKDIADVTNVSINTSLGRMRYALINLRRLIEEKKLILTNS
tara:strand:- start:1716 stop:2312 length:597 start_codon:yes stop_codon:yes gene_type:complete